MRVSGFNRETSQRRQIGKYLNLATSSRDDLLDLDFSRMHQYGDVLIENMSMMGKQAQQYSAVGSLSRGRLNERRVTEP